jgi:hypothetical protein
VVIWSHGSGWREANLTPQHRQPADEQKPKVSKAIAFDDGSNDRLYQAELEVAFEKLRNQGILTDLIGFDACLMSMIEVWYGLAPYAAVGVGSQDLEPGYGWDYGHWKTMTFLAALRHDRIDAPWVVDGPINGEFDETQLAEREPAKVFNDLAETPGVEITIKRKSSDLMHLKSYQIDGRLLRTGAANFSASGLKRQDNDLIVIESPGAAASFKRNFEARYASGG